MDSPVALVHPALQEQLDDLASLAVPAHRVPLDEVEPQEVQDPKAGLVPQEALASKAVQVAQAQQEQQDLEDCQAFLARQASPEALVLKVRQVRMASLVALDLKASKDLLDSKASVAIIPSTC